MFNNDVKSIFNFLVNYYSQYKNPPLVASPYCSTGYLTASREEKQPPKVYDYIGLVGTPVECENKEELDKLYRRLRTSDIASKLIVGVGNNGKIMLDDKEAPLNFCGTIKHELDSQFHYYDMGGNEVDPKQTFNIVKGRDAEGLPSDPLYDAQVIKNKLLGTFVDIRCKLSSVHPGTYYINKYPQYFNERMSQADVIKVHTAIDSVENLLSKRPFDDVEDIFPEEVYPIENYIDAHLKGALDGFETIIADIVVTADGKLIHPRHYYVTKKDCALHFFNPELFTGKTVGFTISTMGEQFIKYDFADLHNEYRSVKHAGFGRGPFSHEIASCIAKIREETMEHQQKDIDRPLTVKGNSRQAIVDNGKHKWPAPKRHKGHRK
jgi:hypothetical protein